MAEKGDLKDLDLSHALNNLKKFAGHTKVKQAMLGFFVSPGSLSKSSTT
jgi:hypothetical protein